MAAENQLKCTCASCGHVISYSYAEVGKTIKCPKCKEKSQLPPAPKQAPAVSPAEPDAADEEIRRCPSCRTKLSPQDAVCPFCEDRRRRNQAVPVRILAYSALVAVAAVIVFVVVRYSHLLPFRNRAASTPAAALPATLEPPRVRMPKSTNDFRFRNFVLDDRRNGDVRLVTGDIENISDNLYRRLKADLELLDASGAKIGSLTDSIVELPPRQTWHIISKTTDNRAASVRVVAVTEETPK